MTPKLNVQRELYVESDKHHKHMQGIRYGADGRGARSGGREAGGCYCN